MSDFILQENGNHLQSETGSGIGIDIPWLTGWDKRIEITVSNTNIDSNLTHFPLLLTLGISVGTGNDDVSAVFDELTSDDNRKKIAVTKSDAMTQIYVEIERWDDANEQAWLWVSKSDLTLSSSGTTTLYLYYDSTQDDNTTYVADAGSRTEVWDSNYMAVWHLGESSGDAIDSTSNNHDGTFVGSLPDAKPGKIGYAQDFDNSGDYITADSVASEISTNGAWSYYAWFNSSATSGDTHVDQLISYHQNTSNILRIAIPPTNYILFYDDDTNSPDQDIGFGENYADGQWHQMVATRESGSGNKTLYVYIDGSQEATGSANPTLSNANQFSIGQEWDSGPTPSDFFYGLISELRISNIQRPAAWVKASYYSEEDNLVSWGSEEIFS